MNEKGSRGGSKTEGFFGLIRTEVKTRAADRLFGRTQATGALVVELPGGGGRMFINAVARCRGGSIVGAERPAADKSVLIRGRKARRRGGKGGFGKESLLGLLNWRGIRCARGFHLVPTSLVLLKPLTCRQEKGGRNSQLPRGSAEKGREKFGRMYKGRTSGKFSRWGKWGGRISACCFSTGQACIKGSFCRRGEEK